MDIEVTQALSNYISQKFLKQTNRSIEQDTRLLSSGLIDSFSLVDLVLFVEDNFGVTIDDTELNAESFDTFGELVALIETRRGG